METKRKIKLAFNFILVLTGLIALIQYPLAGIFILGAVLTQGLLGPAHNKVGNIVTASWKGINYARGYVIPANPNTEAQQAVRAKMAAMVALLQQLLPTLIPFAWDPFAVKMSGFNSMFKENYEHLDASNLVTLSSIISKGTLESASITDASYDGADGFITINFSSAISGNGLATDSGYFVIIDKTNNSVKASSGGLFTRDDGTYVAQIEADLTETDLIVWLFMYRGTGSEFIVSDSDSINVIAA